MQKIYDIIENSPILIPYGLTRQSQWAGEPVEQGNFAGRIVQPECSLDFLISLRDNEDGDGLPTTCLGKLIAEGSFELDPSYQKYGLLLLPNLKKLDENFQKKYGGSRWRIDKKVEVYLAERDKKPLVVRKNYDFDLPYRIANDQLGFLLPVAINEIIGHMKDARELLLLSD